MQHSPQYFDTVVNKFELQSRYYVHFRTNTLGKGMKSLIPLAKYCFSTRMYLALKIRNGWYAIKQRKQTKPNPLFRSPQAGLSISFGSSGVVRAGFGKCPYCFLVCFLLYNFCFVVSFLAVHTFRGCTIGLYNDGKRWNLLRTDGKYVLKHRWRNLTMNKIRVEGNEMGLRPNYYVLVCWILLFCQRG